MIHKQILNQVSKQIREEFTTLGMCFHITYRAQELLAEHGIESTVVVGDAAFKLGKSSLANLAYVATYKPTGTTYISTPQGNPEDLFHYWLQVGDFILDFSTFSFKAVIAQMDDLEGELVRTKVKWSPDYLYAHKSTVSPLSKILTGSRVGTYHYKAFQNQDEVIIDNMLSGLKKLGKHINIITL